MGLLFAVGLLMAWFCLAGFCASVIFGTLFYVTMLDPPTSCFGLACVLLILFILFSRNPWGLKLSALLTLASAPDAAAGSVPASLLGVAYVLLILGILLSRRRLGHKVLALLILGLVSGVTNAFLRRSRLTPFPYSRPWKPVGHWSNYNILSWAPEGGADTYTYSFSDLFSDLLHPGLVRVNVGNVRVFEW